MFEIFYRAANKIFQTGEARGQGWTVVHSARPLVCPEEAAAAGHPPAELGTARPRPRLHPAGLREAEGACRTAGAPAVQPAAGPGGEGRVQKFLLNRLVDFSIK